MMAHPLSAGRLFGLKNYVALVSGAGTGIGLICAETLAANGAVVYITGRRKEVLERSAQVHGGDKLQGTGGKLIPLQMDQNDKQSILAAVKRVKEEHGYLNILVNNAGIARGRSNLDKADSGDIEGLSKDLFEVDEKHWADTFQTNVTGYYYMSAAFLPLLKAANDKFKSKQECMHASIVNIASISGIVKNSQNGQFNYNSSKAATNQLTALMATEFSRKSIGIRVNAICPGYWPSEMTTSKSDENNKSSMDNDPRLDKVPAGRSGSEEDMAMLLLTLARDQYITGQCVAIDGGLLRELP